MTNKYKIKYTIDHEYKEEGWEPFVDEKIGFTDQLLMCSINEMEDGSVTHMWFNPPECEAVPNLYEKVFISLAYDLSQDERVDGDVRYIAEKTFDQLKERFKVVVGE